MDRKELTKKYKQTAQPMGVYQIRNVVTGKAFVGSSVNLPGILNRNRFQLQNGLHPNRQLQRDFLAAGAGGFAFEILDTLAPREEGRGDCAEELKELEALWLEKLRAAGAAGYTPG
jgi:hypothetical protein